VHIGIKKSRRKCGNKIGFKVRREKMWQEKRDCTEKQKKMRENKARSRRT